MRQDYRTRTSVIKADKIELGENFVMGDNCNIDVRGTFRVGKCCRFGNNVTIHAEEVTIGDHFFHYEPGLNVGGGGSQFPTAIWRVGDRCVVHNNKINLARPVYIGNDVGLSPDVDIITHGFWQSPLEGYPYNYGSVDIRNGVIVGQRTMILMNIIILEDIVIGAQSVVTKDLLEPKSIYAGNPAKFIRTIEPMNVEQRIVFMNDLAAAFQYLSDHAKYTDNYPIKYDYPFIEIDQAKIDVEKRTIEGRETLASDQLRDFLRRYGIRIYTDRPFVSL